MATSNHIISFRRHDLDNLRTFLTGLVTIHHASIAYGGAGRWSFKSAAFTGNSPILLGFNMLNQSFFMGTFFWISGYVSAQSLEKSTSLSAFLRNKIWRLGAPAVVYTLVVNPLIPIVTLPRWSLGSIFDLLADYYTSLSGVKGALWYTATLLCFDAVAAVLIKIVAPPKMREKSRAPPLRMHENLRRYGWLFVAAVSFLAKTQYPVGKCLSIVSLQPAYAAQYIYAYVLGHIDYRCGEKNLRGPLDQFTTPTKLPRLSNRTVVKSDDLESRSLGKSVVVSVLLMGLIWIPRYLDSPDWFQKTTQQLFGGWNVPSLLYAVWNEVAFNLIGPALMSFFTRYYNRPAVSATWKARYSYAALLVHGPVSVAIGLLADRALFSQESSLAWTKDRVWQTLGPVIMTLGIGHISAWTSFWLGGTTLRWLPWLNQII